MQEIISIIILFIFLDKIYFSLINIFNNNEIKKIKKNKI